MDNDEDRVWFGCNAGFGFIENGVMTMSPSNDINGAVADIAVAHDGSYMLIGMGNCRVFRSEGSDFTSFNSVSGSNNDDTVLPQSGNGRVRVDISIDVPTTHLQSLLQAEAHSAGCIIRTTQVKKNHGQMFGPTISSKPRRFLVTKASMIWHWALHKVSRIWLT